MEPFPFVKQPYDFQMKLWKQTRDENSWAFFMEMGTGKSKLVIDSFIWQWLQGRIDTVLIIAKKGEYANWPDVELPAHMPESVDYVCNRYRSGMQKEEKESMRRLILDHPTKLRILVVNVESLQHEGGVVARVFCKSRRKGLFLVVDESTCIKNHKATRSKALHTLLGFTRYRRIMSGTPVTRSPLDLWGQSYILGKSMLGHTSFYSFRNEYTESETIWLGTRSVKRPTGYKKIDKLQNVIKRFSTIMTRAECIDLPPKVYKKIHVPLTDQQERLYNDMRDEAIAELGDGTIIEATNALGIIARLDQIACGQLKRPDETFEILDCGRPDTLLEQLEVAQGKSLVWCNYRGLLDYLYEMLRKELGNDKVCRYYGGVKDSERQAAISGFQEPGGKFELFLANQQSAGYGLTLTRGKNNFYYSNGYNLEYRLQSEDRTMRIGQDSSVLYTDLTTMGTVNDRVLELLRLKKNLAHEVLGTVITEWI